MLKENHDINSGPGYNLEVQAGLDTWRKNLEKVGRNLPVIAIEQVPPTRNVDKINVDKIYDASKAIEEKAREVSKKTGLPLDQVYKEMGFDPDVFVDDFSRSLDYHSSLITPDEAVKYSENMLEKIKERELFSSRPEWFGFLDGEKYKPNFKEKLKKYGKVAKVAAATAGFILATAFNSGCIGETSADHISDLVYTEDGKVIVDQTNMTNGIDVYTEKINLSGYNVIDLVSFGDTPFNLLPGNPANALEVAIEKTLEKAEKIKDADAIIVDTWKNPRFGYSDAGIGLILGKSTAGGKNLTGLPSEFSGLPVIELNRGIGDKYSLGLGPLDLVKINKDYIDQQIKITNPEEHIKAIGVLGVDDKGVAAYLMQDSSMDRKVPVEYK